MRNKSGALFNQVLVHLILIGIIFAVFITAVAGNVNARGVRQQVIEKQTALLIDSAIPGMDFEIRKKGVGGFVHSVELKDGRIFVGVDNFGSLRGYPYFSKYSVSVSEEDNKFVVSVR
jgi:hypothetical protein